MRASRLNDDESSRTSNEMSNPTPPWGDDAVIVDISCCDASDREAASATDVSHRVGGVDYAGRVAVFDLEEGTINKRVG